MIVHQHVDMNSHTEAFRCLGQQLEEMEAVGVATVNRFALVTTGGDMVIASGGVQCSKPCHGVYRNSPVGKPKLGLSKVEIRTRGFYCFPCWGNIFVVIGSEKNPELRNTAIRASPVRIRLLAASCALGVLSVREIRRATGRVLK